MNHRLHCKIAISSLVRCVIFSIIYRPFLCRAFQSSQVLHFVFGKQVSKYGLCFVIL